MGGQTLTRRRGAAEAPSGAARRQSALPVMVEASRAACTRASGPRRARPRISFGLLSSHALRCTA
eukprot:scaffold125981_cov28-Tisochrysis_lutea.AAC.2